MSVKSSNSEAKKTYQQVVETLIEARVKRVFTLPGLGITWSLPGFFERKEDLDVVLTRSEQSASVMAQVTGKLTGKPGVLMGQGPWISTTGSFGILEAYFSGSPMVILTETSDYNGYGQYGVYQTMTGDYGAADIQASLKAITKFSTYATEPEAVIYGLQMAYKHASTPRKGPAAVIMKTPVIKQDVDANQLTALYQPQGYWKYNAPKPDPEAMEELAALITEAKSPVIVAGQGVYDARIGTELEQFARDTGSAVATSYNGKGVIDELSSVAVGMLGTWGHKTANRVLQQADLVVILGASMAPDYTRFRDPDLIRPGEQKIVQVDVDPHNAGWVYPVDLAITGDVKDVIDFLLEKKLTCPDKETRLEKIAQIKEDTGYNTQTQYSSRPGTLHHAEVTDAVQQFIGPDDMLALDAGANRIWNTHRLRMRNPNHLLVPGGAGGMGWSAPAATAAKLTLPEKRVTCLTGDGGFTMSIDVLATCVQYNLPVVFVVSNNSGLGMVRDNMGDKKIAVDFGDLDFATIAKGFGAAGISVDNRSSLDDALIEAHKSQRPTVINVRIDPEASYLPAADTEPLV